MKAAKQFLHLVEIRTKVASVIPFLIGVLYAYYHFNAYRPLRTLSMFVSLICIDMATTAINNYVDYQRATLREGYGFSEHNGVMRSRLSVNGVRLIIVLLLLTGIGFGLWLVWLTDWLVLALGALSFAIGILYSYGPIPISRTPLGEAFSGGFMGILIPFLTIYIQLEPGALIAMTMNGSQLTIVLAWYDILLIVLYAMPLFCGIANIMLANNICDYSEDIANGRFTLVRFIGNKKALIVFQGLYIAAFVSFNLALFLGSLPLWNVIFNLLAIDVWRSVRVFKRQQSKAKTFHIAVDNFIRIGVAMAALMLCNISLAVCV